VKALTIKADGLGTWEGLGQFGTLGNFKTSTNQPTSQTTKPQTNQLTNLSAGQTCNRYALANRSGIFHLRPVESGLRWTRPPPR